LIIGGVLGGVAYLALAIGAVVYFVRRPPSGYTSLHAHDS
jgi:hypothetical protein